MATILCGTLWFGQAGSIEFEAPSAPSWNDEAAEMTFQSGTSDSITYEQFINNYNEPTTAVFPKRQWFRAAQLAGLNMAVCDIGVVPTKERTQISADSSNITGSMLVDFELAEYRPYQASVAGLGSLNPDGRDVNVSYDTYSPARTYSMRVYEPGIGSPPFNMLFYGPGKGGGKLNYGPVAAVANDMGIAMTCGDYPDTNVALGGEGQGFDYQLRALQFREFATTKGEAAVGWAFTLRNGVAGHSGGCNTASMNTGLKHEGEEDGEPTVFSTLTLHGNKVVCSILNSTQAVDNVVCPYEDSYSTIDPDVPHLIMTGEYDPDRTYNTLPPRRKMYDSITGVPAILRYHLYAYHAFGTFTNDNRLDTQHVQDWLVKDYCLNLMRAFLDYTFYDQQAGLDFIKNDSYLPAQIISTSEEHDI